MLKKGDINKNKVSMCIRRVASITSLKGRGGGGVGITKEDALRGHSGQNKCTRKHTNGGRKEVDQEREENEEPDHSV